MNPKKQQIAIAEACGVKIPKLFIKWPWFEFVIGAELPDYLNDLNAMHQAEATLSETELSWMYVFLEEILERDARVGGSTDLSKRKIWRATAKQRARAFLMTKEK